MTIILQIFRTAEFICED